MLRETLASPKTVLITAHRSPDADAMGSALALYNVLLKLGHKVSVVVPDSFPGFLAWMKGAGEVKFFQEQRGQGTRIIGKAEVVFCLDYNNLERIGEMGPLIQKTNATTVLIDHHIDPSDNFDFILSDTAASSTAELIFRFLRSMSWDHFIDVDVAECIYAGIMTDTGSFRFSSTSAQTHRITAELIEIGLEPNKVHSAIFDNYRFDRLKLIGHALSEKLEFDPELGVSIISLSLEEKTRYNHSKGDTEGLVNYGLSIKGARLAVFLSEESDFVKLSFRSKGDVDVNVLARAHFNGGGHKNAAGGKLVMDLEAALKQLKTVLRETLA